MIWSSEGNPKNLHWSTGYVRKRRTTAELPGSGNSYVFTLHKCGTAEGNYSVTTNVGLQIFKHQFER